MRDGTGRTGSWNWLTTRAPLGGAKNQTFKDWKKERGDSVHCPVLGTLALLGTWLQKIPTPLQKYYTYCGIVDFSTVTVKVGTQRDPIFSELGTLASRMGTQKAHVCIIDWMKLIRWNNAFKRGGEIVLKQNQLHWQSGLGFISVRSVITSNQSIDIRWRLHWHLMHS